MTANLIGLDTRKTELLRPFRILACSGASDADVLLKPKHLQLFMSDKKVCRLSPGGFILLDFNKEISGGLRILFGEVRRGEARIRVRLGESAGEAMAEKGEKGACTDHSIRDLILPAQFHTELDTPNSGFRFARIDNAGSVEVELIAVYARFMYTDLKETGEFFSEDALVNDIYNTARYTAKLCVQNGVIWDGIKRDRVVWAGDLHPAMLTCLYAFNAAGQVKASLEFLKQTTPGDEWVNKIPAYSVWWIICLYDYFFFSGDKWYLTENIDYIANILTRLNASLLPDGEFDFTRSGLKLWQDSEFFLDWPTSLTPSSECGFRALMRFGILKAKKIMEIAGNNPGIASELLKKLELKKTYYNNEKQIAAMRILAGESDPKTDYKVLTDNGAKGVSCFMSYYILRACAAAGSAEKALNVMKEYFGGMLERGATTFFEDFNIDWLKNSGRIDELVKEGQKDLHGDFGGYCYKGFRHSLCHSWASGALPFLTENILGFKPQMPGCGQVLLEPVPGALKNVSGKIATPLGTLSVKIQNGRVAEYDAPYGMEIKLQR